MTDNWKKLHEKTDDYIGTLVITGEGSFKVCLFKGLIDDPDDYYYEYIDHRGGNCYSSCVGDFYPLKGFIEDEKYNYLVSVWNLNNESKVK